LAARKSLLAVTTMSDVVAASDLSMGAVYRYFENKEDQFAGVIADLHESLFEAGRSPVSLQEDPTRRCS